MHSTGASEVRHWRLLLAATVGTGISGIPTYSIGLFAGPLSTEFGWSRTQVLFAITLTAAGTMLLTPLAGRLVDLFGARRVALPAVSIMAFALALQGLVESYPAYVAQWAIVGIAGAFCSPVVWTVAVARRFVRHRGLALAIALSGIGLVGVMAPLGSAWLIDRFGWRWAFAGLAAYALGVILPFTLVYFRDSLATAPAVPSASDPVGVPGLGLGVGEALRVREFWILAIAFLLASNAVMAIVLHFAPMLIDTGLSPLRAAGALSVLSTSAVVGRLGAGLLLDRLFAPRVGTAILLLPVLACAGLFVGATDGLFPYAYAVLIGLAVGAEFDLASYLTARYFGFRSFATIYGLLFAVFSVGITCGPLLAGMLYDRTGSYRLSLITLIASFVTAAMFLLLCRRYPEFGSDRLAET